MSRTLRALLDDLHKSEAAMVPRLEIMHRLREIDAELRRNMPPSNQATDGATMEVGTMGLVCPSFSIKAARIETGSCEIGEGTVLYEPSNIYGCRIGRHCSIGPFVEIQRGVVIGNSVMMGSHSIIAANTVIGNEVFIARGVRIANCTYPVPMQGDHKPDHTEWQLDPVTIGNRVVIGDGAIILPGVSIGEGAVIGAGAVVTKNIGAAGSPWVGSPARPMVERNR